MKFTDEQLEIIESDENIKVNAVAGSGKTTTILEYAQSKPKQSSKLYLAFNRTVRNEANYLVNSRGIPNMRVETAHSLAYKNIIPAFGYRVSPSGYNSYELVDTLGIESRGAKLTEYIMANHVNRLVQMYCNSNKESIHDINYIDSLTTPRARVFAMQYYDHIEALAIKFWNKMDRGSIDVTHDFYLKKFQLSNPDLDFDYILFDEGQDASPAMLDIFSKQDSTKVIVGDTHQQIYGWRYAINSLQEVEFRDLNLTTSFRFSQDIADLALSALDLKRLIGVENTIDIRGVGTSTKVDTEAIVSRTNLGLLAEAIRYIDNNNGSLYFEGNINSYVYADNGSSLYDVLNLKNGSRGYIRNALIKSMDSYKDLEKFAEDTEDNQLQLMMEIVKEYGNRIPFLLKTLKSRHMYDKDKHKADKIFSTTHKSKGMEYDSVTLTSDFITPEKIDKMLKRVEREKSEGILTTLPDFNEEINMLYVAITRAKSIVNLPIEFKSIAKSNSDHIKCY